MSSSMEIEVSETPQQGGLLSWIGPTAASTALTISLLVGGGAALHEAHDFSALAGRYRDQAEGAIAISWTEGMQAESQISALVSHDAIEVGVDLAQHSVPARWFEQLRSVRTLEDIGFTLPWNE